MKRKPFLLSLTAVVCAFTLSACGQNADSPKETPDASDVPAAAQTEAPAAVPKDYDSVIDASFEAGRLVLTEQEISLPDPDTCTVVAPPRKLVTSAGVPYPDEADIRNALRSGIWNVVAFSPDGKTQIGYLTFGDNEQHYPLLIRDNRVTMVYPSGERGAKDTNRAMQQYYQSFYFCGESSSRFSGSPLAIGSDPLAWSPDGRYYFAENYIMAMLNSASVHYIVDTETGEMISLDSFPFYRGSGTAIEGIIYSGCFSADGKSFFAAARTNKYTEEEVSCIIRYDLETFEGTLLAETGAYYGGTSMRCLSDGTMLGLFWNGREQSIFRINPDRSIRSVKEPYYRPARSILYSTDSGWAVLTDSEQLQGQYATAIIPGPGLQLFRAEDVPAVDPDTMLFVNNDTGVPEMGSFTATWGILNGGFPDRSTMKQYLKFPYQFLDVELSPDGRYAGILLSRRLPKDEVLLMVVRLEDRAYLVAEGLVIDDEPPKSGALKNVPKYYSVRKRKDSNLPILNWTEAGLLVTSGSSHLLRIAENPLSFPPPEPEEEVPDGPEVHSTELFDYIVLEDGTAEITWYGGDATELVIPPEVDGIPVTSIGAQAFCGKKTITEVSGLQHTVPGKGDILVSIEMPDAIINIGDGAFAGCASLTEIEFPAKVRTVGLDLFKGCTELRDIRMSLDNPYLEIRDEALFSKEDSRLICYMGSGKEYTIPDGTLSIGDGAFRSCTQLTGITIPGSVTQIGSYASAKCRKLASVTLPDSIEEMGDNPFLDCLKLAEIVISPSHPYLELIDGVLFSKPDKRLICYPRALAAEEYTVPDGTVIIGNDAFGTVPSLKRITIPASVVDVPEIEADNPGIEIVFSE